MLFEASSAVTVKLKEIPVVAFDGPATAKCVAEAVTVIELEVPVMEAVSVAVMVWVPGVIRVTEKVPVPLASVEAAGSTA